MARRLLESPTPYFALAGLLLVAAVASQFELRVPSRPVRGVEALESLRDRDDLNVVFLLVDTLRAHRLGIYGYERPTSPILDEAANYGIVFEDVVSQSSWTKSSMASMWTATLPRRNGILRFDHVIPESAVMPAELFRDAGYRTVGLWRNGWVEANFGFGQGFDTYLRPAVGAERARLHRQAHTVGPVVGSDEDLTLSALDFLEQFGDQRFFLYLHYMDIHQYAYDEAAPSFGNAYPDLYDQAIHWTDRLLGRLLQALEDEGLMTRTLVVIASDHGEAFLEHGHEGHARDLYDEVTRVPLILLPPFRLDPGVRVPTTVANVDIWPTVLDLVGLPPLPRADGRSLVPSILEAAGARSASQAEAERPILGQIVRGWGRPKQVESPSTFSVTRGGLRLIRNPDGSDELYDRRDDPREQRDLSDERPEQVAELVRDLEAYQSTPPLAWGADPAQIELDEMRLNHLRALGYVVKP